MRLGPRIVNVAILCIAFSLFLGEAQGIRFTRGGTTEKASDACSELNRLNTSYHLLSWEPRVVLIKNFAEPKDLEVFVNLASPKMAESGLKLRPGEEFNSSIRTSTGAFVDSKEDKAVRLWIRRNFEPRTMRSWWKRLRM